MYTNGTFTNGSKGSTSLWLYLPKNRCLIKGPNPLVEDTEKGYM